LSQPPAHPKIYHITHVSNLAGMVADGKIYSDASMIARGGPNRAIGMSKIKERRLHLPVTCHPDTMVGDYVPFNFCPRSVMLFVIHRGNPELAFTEGQNNIVHLEADLHSVINWAQTSRRQWAYCTSNAGANYADFDSNIGGLNQIDWDAVANNDFRDTDVKDSKQSEFLVLESFPWTLISRIGVINSSLKATAERAISNTPLRPVVEVKRDWYY